MLNCLLLIVTVPFTQPISTIVMFWTTPLPPPQCGRHISMAPKGKSVLNTLDTQKLYFQLRYRLN